MAFERFLIGELSWVPLGYAGFVEDARLHRQLAVVSGSGSNWSTNAYDAAKISRLQPTRAVAFDFESGCPSWCQTDMTKDMLEHKALVARISARMTINPWRSLRTSPA